MIKQVSYYDILSIDENKIQFRNGNQIVFHQCAGKDDRYSEKCVGVRNALAPEPYVEFFTPGGNTRVVFDKTGILERKNNQKCFGQFHIDIQKFGYSTFDVS